MEEGVDIWLSKDEDFEVIHVLAGAPGWAYYDMLAFFHKFSHESFHKAFASVGGPWPKYISLNEAFDRLSYTPEALKWENRNREGVPSSWLNPKPRKHIFGYK